LKLAIKRGAEMERICKNVALAATISLIIPQALAEECTFETCKAGTTAVTYFKKDDPYYTCPTRELATYVTTIVGLASMQAMLGVGMPNISRQDRRI
jgi:hypothetical protein